MKCSKTFFTATLLCFITVLAATSCGTKENGWLSDYDQAKELADKQNKNILLFVSGEDWDGVSTNIRTSIFETEDFLGNAEKDFVLVHLDFSDSLYESTEVAENATEEEKAKAEALQAQLEKNSQVIMDLNANSMAFPVTLLVTNNGFVYGIIEYTNEITTAKQYLDKIASFDDVQKTVEEKSKKIASSKGAEKAQAIDDLLEALPETHRYLAMELAMQVPDLDPDNTTGLLGKYEMLVAYSNAVEKLGEGDFIGAIQELIDPIDNGNMTAQQIQELYFNAAFFYSKMGDSYVNEVIDYLKKAYEVAPDSEAAKLSIKPALDMFLQATENTAQ